MARRWVAAVEVLLAALVVGADLLVPTFVLLALAALSLALRRERPASLGFASLPRPWRAAAAVLALTLGWTLFEVGLVLPVLEHATGKTQDLGDFAGLQGDPARLALLLALSWTLAAVGEETAYRGYVLSRARQAGGTAVAVLVSAALFGLAHTEQGVVGVAVTFLDGLALAWLRLHYRTLWAPVLAHGFNNTVGLVTFFLVGPVHGLW